MYSGSYMTAGGANWTPVARNYLAAASGKPISTSERVKKVIPGKLNSYTGEEESIAKQVGSSKDNPTGRDASGDGSPGQNGGTDSMTKNFSAFERFNRLLDLNLIPKKASLISSPERAFYKYRKSTETADNPLVAHQVATGRSAPLSAQIGYSQMLPLLAAISTFINPKIGAGLLMAQQIGKGLYEHTHPQKVLQDIAFAKSLKRPEYSNLISGVGDYDTARKTTYTPSKLTRFLKLG